jgi:hypothetical protein
MGDRPTEGIVVTKVLAQELLGVAHRGVTVGTAANQFAIRQLALAMQLQQIDLGDTQGLTGASMTGDDVYSQVMPRSGASGGDHTSGRIGKGKAGLGAELDLRVAAPKQVFIAPVRGGLAAIEQPGLGQHHRAGAGRVDPRAPCVHAPDPVHQRRMSTVQTLIRAQPEFR